MYRSTRKPSEDNNAYFDPTMYRNGTHFLNCPLFMYVHPRSLHTKVTLSFLDKMQLLFPYCMF